MTDSAAPAPAAVTATPVDTSSNAGSVEVVDVTPQTLEEKLAPVEEKAPPVEEKTEKPKEKVAKKLSSVREREAKVAAREAEAAQKLAEASEKLSQAEARAKSIEMLKTNPSKVLADLGISFNDLATALLAEEATGDSTPSEIDALKQELKDIKDGLLSKEEQAKADEQAAVDRQLQAAIADIKVVIDNHIAQNPDKYDLILSTQNHPLVYEIMKESFDQTGEVMMYTEACDLAEDYLAEQVKKTFGNSKKIKEFVSPPAPAKPERTSFGRTLSAQATQVAESAGKGPDMSKLSHEERIKILSGRLRFN